MNYRKVFFDNWGIKLVSLGLSLTLWFYVTSKGKTELTLTVPLELRNVPQNMAVVGDVVGYLEVRVQGQERQLRDITSGKKVYAVLDLSLAKRGENVVLVSPDDIKRPSGLTVTRISPFEVRVILEPLVRKTFRLVPVLHGAPAAGYRVAGVSVTPAKITVEGPDSIMRQLSDMQTMPIDIGGAKESVSVVPRIDYGGKPLKIQENDISVRVAIERVHT